MAKKAVTLSLLWQNKDALVQTMIIGVDIDGILADFNTAYIQLVKDQTGRDLFPAGYHPGIIETWSYPETFGYTKKEISAVWKWIEQDNRFWYNLDPLPDAPAFGSWLNTLRPLNEVYFITSRVGQAVQLQTIAWLINRLGVNAPTVLISSEKGLCCKALKVDFYIDDKNENCTDVYKQAPQTRCYMLAAPWNAQHPDIPRIDSLSQFQQVINGQ